MASSTTSQPSATLTAFSSPTESDEGQTDGKVDDLFQSLWPIATHDSNVTLHAFRRFKTSHLMNLRFLEAEVEQLDRDLYQAGLTLGVPVGKPDRLLLRRNTHDNKNIPIKVSGDTVLRLRGLIKEYGVYPVNDKAEAADRSMQTRLSYDSTKS
jgi:hypothetical protein